MCDSWLQELRAAAVGALVQLADSYHDLPTNVVVDVYVDCSKPTEMRAYVVDIAPWNLEYVRTLLFESWAEVEGLDQDTWRYVREESETQVGPESFHGMPAEVAGVLLAGGDTDEIVQSLRELEKGASP